MKKNFILALVLALGISGYAANHVFAVEAINVGNKTCPVSGEEIGEESMKGQEVTVEYKGKVYNLCCPMCKKDFNKDPEKYIKILQEKGDIK